MAVRDLFGAASLLATASRSRTGTRRSHTESVDVLILAELDGGLSSGWLSDFAGWTRAVVLVLGVGNLRYNE
jgi:hypothetical protein